MKQTGRTKIIYASLTALLLAAAFGVVMLYNYEERRNEELEAKVAELTAQEQRSAVMQRVNAQMEEIANEQRQISDEQREAAEEQALVAQQERMNAEEQRKQAEYERQNAQIAEQKAVESSKAAHNERLIAEQQRAEAELSKRIADTLSYQMLARSLANNAITQRQGGNHELADMLAYTAVIFAKRYRADINSSTVYQALAMTSQNKNVWNRHKGSVRDIAFYDKKGEDFVSCSTYGEVMRHHLNNDKLISETIFSNPNYDFRDIYIDRDNKVIYALSRNSCLFVFSDNKKYKVVNVNIPHLTKMEPVGDHFILFGEQGMALFNPATLTIEKEKVLPFKIQSMGVFYGKPMLFDNKGQQHIINSFDNIEIQPVPIKNGQVTAYAESKNKHTKAYGMNDGTVYFINSQGKIIQLAGHMSRISKIKINGNRLYTASYDGVLNAWQTNQSKIEPMPQFTTNGWIINFTYDLKKTNIWTGDQKGNLTKALISQPAMIQRLKNKLKRSMTRSEWEHYVGTKVPYEAITGKEAKL